MDNNEIKVRINGGYLVARRNPDSNYDGIYIVFETDNGIVVDVALVEAKAENDKSKIDVYCYEDAYNEDFTHKYTLGVSEIYKALEDFWGKWE